MAHDWGGGVAWVTAGMYGKELINKLIICGAVHFGIMATNMHVGQYLKSLYVMSFIVSGHGQLPSGLRPSLAATVCAHWHS